MTSLWYEALLVAEEQCVEEGHHEDGRIIIVVYTEQAYAPAVCGECLDYAYEIKASAEGSDTVANHHP